MRTIKITREFITQRDANAEKYVSRGRSLAQMRLACQHELYEYDKLRTGEWKNGDDWKVDGIDPKYGRIEVKNCPGIYLFTPNAQKTAVQRHQIGHVENFFCVRMLGPTRLFEVGDKVQVEEIGFFPFEETMNRMRPSTVNSGHYITLESLTNSTPIEKRVKPVSAHILKRQELMKLLGITSSEASKVMKFTKQLLKGGRND